MPRMPDLSFMEKLNLVLDDEGKKTVAELSALKSTMSQMEFDNLITDLKDLIAEQEWKQEAVDIALLILKVGLMVAVA